MVAHSSASESKDHYISQMFHIFFIPDSRFFWCCSTDVFKALPHGVALFSTEAFLKQKLRFPGHQINWVTE